jgi:hypothetical protein
MDDWDKLLSFVTGAAARRSNSSLGTYLNHLLELALARPLTAPDLGLGDTATPEGVRSACDAFAGELAECYLSNRLTWADADLAANNFYELMIARCGGTVPTYAWDVYLAFDTGECTPPGGDLVTRPILEALQSARDA